MPYFKPLHMSPRQMSCVPGKSGSGETLGDTEGRAARRGSKLSLSRAPAVPPPDARLFFAHTHTRTRFLTHTHTQPQPLLRSPLVQIRAAAAAAAAAPETKTILLSLSFTLPGSFSAGFSPSPASSFLFPPLCLTVLPSSTLYGTSA